MKRALAFSFFTILAASIGGTGCEDPDPTFPFDAATTDAARDGGATVDSGSGDGKGDVISADAVDGAPDSGIVDAGLIDASAKDVSAADATDGGTP